jgi:hypothetical protein
MYMKKQLLFALMALFAGYSSAQTCTPQYQDSTFGAWPDTTTNLATAYVNIPYTQLLDFKAPEDAGDIDPTFSGQTIISYRVTNVSGLPSTFNYQCSATNCQYPGGTAGCAQLTGTAVAADLGVHNITISIKATVQISIPPLPPTQITQDRDFPGYKLVVLPEELSTGILAPNQSFIYPNPASTVVNIVNANNYETIEVYSVNGQLITKKAVSFEDETVDISDLNEGMYFIHLVKGETKSVHKFTKK